MNFKKGHPPDQGCPWHEQRSLRETIELIGPKVQAKRRKKMNVKKLVVAAVAVVALASSSLAAAADVPKLQVGPSVVKVNNGKLVLIAKCIGESECQSVLTARIDVKNGGLGGQIFSVDPGQTEKLVFNLEANVRAWLKTHHRSTLVISARTSNEEYEVVWRGTFRLKLVA